jgi:tagatose-1,6-bisphosphate aldolase non-catalytic subunit AgaZ/GatZ
VSIEQAVDAGIVGLGEVTNGQVNQFGGYSRMQPAIFPE